MLTISFLSYFYSSSLYLSFQIVLLISLNLSVSFCLSLSHRHTLTNSFHLSSPSFFLTLFRRLALPPLISAVITRLFLLSRKFCSSRFTPKGVKEEGGRRRGRREGKEDDRRVGKYWMEEGGQRFW